MKNVELNHLSRLHAEAEALVAVLVEKSSHADFGSDAAYRLNRLVDKASTRVERRYRAKMDLIMRLAKIPTDISLGYITVDGFVRQCLAGPGRALPSDFKEWANPSLNRG